MEFFSTKVRAPNAAVPALFEGIGGQVGRFIERKRAEAELGGNSLGSLEERPGPFSSPGLPRVWSPKPSPQPSVIIGPP